LYAESPIRQQSEKRPPRWRHWRRFLRPQPPAALRPWLLDPGSLTQHLIRASAGHFRVELLAQRWQRPTLSEARLLAVEPGAPALVREVVLRGNETPWVYARSVMPMQALRGDLLRLKKLRNSSLGALLFRYPQLRRTPFELAQINGLDLPPGQRCQAVLWGRRSRFELDGRGLIVSEIFLPAFAPQYTPRRSPRR
jgi:chorismate--pyruvate lyase